MVPEQNVRNDELRAGEVEVTSPVTGRRYALKFIRLGVDQPEYEGAEWRRLPDVAEEAD
jgi:hypothetical protein